MQKETTSSVYNNFSRQYPLAKTLRFELKPVGKTVDFSKEVIKKDKTVDECYNQAKFYFDMLHREFIESALRKEQAKNINFQEFAKIFYEQNKIIKQNKSGKDSKEKEINNKSQRIIDNARKSLYTQIRKIFDDEAENWKVQYQNKLKKSDLKQKGVDF